MNVVLTLDRRSSAWYLAMRSNLPRTSSDIASTVSAGCASRSSTANLTLLKVQFGQIRAGTFKRASSYIIFQEIELLTL